MWVPLCSLKWLHQPVTVQNASFSLILEPNNNLTFKIQKQKSLEGKQPFSNQFSSQGKFIQHGKVRLKCCRGVECTGRYRDSQETHGDTSEDSKDEFPNVREKHAQIPSPLRSSVSPPVKYKCST